MSSVPELLQLGIEAVKARASKVVIPLLEQDGAAIGVLGSGILLKRNNRHFLVTAAHVGVETVRRNLAIPAGKPGQRSKVVNCATLSSNSESDVSVFRIDNSGVVDAISTRWQFYEETAFTQITDNSKYFIYGYPSSLAKPHGDKLVSDPFACVTQEFRGEIIGLTSPPAPEIDIFLDHRAEVVDKETGRFVSIPDLRGISGSPVWRVASPEESSDRIWSTQTSAAVVGLQVSYLSGSWIRCRKWSAVLELVDKLSGT